MRMGYRASRAAEANAHWACSKADGPAAVVGRVLGDDDRQPAILGGSIDFARVEGSRLDGHRLHACTPEGRGFQGEKARARLTEQCADAENRSRCHIHFRAAQRSAWRGGRT